MAIENGIHAVSGVNVLIVDDHDALRKSLRARIHASFPGLDFLEARCGEDAVAIAADRRPQIVLMDIALPDISGIEATRRIKARLPLTWVVMLSMHHDQARRALAAAAGANAFVAKRDLPEELIGRLREVVARMSGMQTQDESGKQGR